MLGCLVTLNVGSLFMCLYRVDRLYSIFTVMLHLK